MQTVNDTHWEPEFIDSPNAGLYLGIAQISVPAAWRALICCSQKCSAAGEMP